VSAYGNVGLSLGHPDNLTSLCGHFTVFGKLVICAMMIRGRHRGMPYALDRAITLPSDRLAEQEPEGNDGEEMRRLRGASGPGRITKAHTQ
jgi:Trk-type K+ transport system membrane component